MDLFFKANDILYLKLYKTIIYFKAQSVSKF